MTLGDVTEFKYGLTAKAADVGGYRLIRITDITDEGKLSPAGAKYVEASSDAQDCLVQPGDLLVARTGATFGKTLLVQESAPAVYASFLIRLRLDPTVALPAFYWHFAQSRAYWKQTERLVGREGQPQFNANVLKRIAFPVPELGEQHRIVDLLDGFDSLVSDLSIGLPAELNARRQQYEHYRDRLLTFKEASG